jgi:ABC-type uncharacterized transport system, permease component
MSLFWLRVAVALYGVSMLYALIALLRRREIVSRFTLPIAGVGLTLHFVALVEAFRSGSMASMPLHESESLLAFLMMLLFVVVYYFYRTTSPGIVVLPTAFLLTLSAALAQSAPQFASPMLRSGWIYTHIALIFAGYAALFFSFIASILYLLHERSLKAKKLTGISAKLPALETIDDLGYRLLLIGFPFMTFGLIAGSVIAQAEFGSKFFHDPKVLFSVLMWGVYMVMLYTRWSAGWRGRKAAVLSAFAFAAALSAWAANYISGMHRFVSR